MKPIILARTAVSLSVGTLLLTACGGGDSDGGAPAAVNPVIAGTDVPQSAIGSSSGALAFVKTVAASSDNSAAPITVGDVTLGSSDTDEPDAGV